MPKNEQHPSIINGRKVTLRSVMRKDLPTLYIWMQNKHLLNAINRSKKTTFRSQMTWYKGIQKDENQIIFSIVHNRSRELLGQCGLRDIDQANKKAELWIYLGNSKSRGRGVGTEAVINLLDYAFNMLALNKTYLYVLDFNIKARHFYQRLGFIQEGLFRKDVLLNGTFHDTVHLAILREEYEKGNNEESFNQRTFQTY